MQGLRVEDPVSKLRGDPSPADHAVVEADERCVREMCEAGAPALQLSDGASPDLRVAVTESSSQSWVARLDDAFDALRRRSARESVRTIGRDEGYRLEDAAAIGARLPPSWDAAAVEAWLRRRLEPTTTLSIRSAPVESVDEPSSGVLVLAASIRSRAGFSPHRDAYITDAEGRVHVEAFEVHVAEHCNLRCANCCNMSPFVAPKQLTVTEIESICARMRTALVADVIKIMGGEPLLHPEIVDIIRVLRRSGVARRVRLFTNGLRLRAMPDEFWSALDELTISNYSSAPLRPAILELARARSHEHGFVLNVKAVTEFSRVLGSRFVPEPAAAQTFERCWLRHRCLIVRDRRFYMCTRAAYAPDFLQTVAHEAVPPGVQIVREDDGVAIDTPQLAARLVAYLNRPNPLGACHYCHGGDGSTVPHHQLTRGEVAAGLMSRASEAKS